jgi:hypothetical protein
MFTLQCTVNSSATDRQLTTYRPCSKTNKYATNRLRMDHVSLSVTPNKSSLLPLLSSSPMVNTFVFPCLTVSRVYHLLRYSCLPHKDKSGAVGEGYATPLDTAKGR